MAVGERGGTLLQRLHRLVGLAQRFGPAQVALEAAQHDADAGHLLAHVVVQVARDPRALRFLRVDQAAGEIAVLLVGSPQLRRLWISVCSISLRSVMSSAEPM